MANVSKADLVSRVAAATGLRKSYASKAVDAVLETIRTELAQGNRVQLAGFGSFETKRRAARQGRNPQTQEALTIPASTSVGFRPASSLKQRLGGTEQERGG